MRRQRERCKQSRRAGLIVKGVRERVGREVREGYFVSLEHPNHGDGH